MEQQLDCQEVRAGILGRGGGCLCSRGHACGCVRLRMSVACCSGPVGARRFGGRRKAPTWQLRRAAPVSDALLADPDACMHCSPLHRRTSWSLHWRAWAWAPAMTSRCRCAVCPHPRARTCASMTTLAAHRPRLATSRRCCAACRSPRAASRSLMRMMSNELHFHSLQRRWRAAAGCAPVRCCLLPSCVAECSRVLSSRVICVT